MHVRKVHRIWVFIALGALCLTAAAVGLRPGAPGDGRPAPDGMAFVDGGPYTPLYEDRESDGPTQIAAFYMSRYPVTNGEYLSFVRANPAWQRSNVKTLFADDAYLQHWRGDVDFGPDSLANRPVVNVSWFAAQAYADWKGMRLPTTAEWEYAAGFGQTRGEGSDDPAFRQRMLAWYARPAPATMPAIGSTECNYWGVCDLHGLVWEWVDDFNSALVTGESRNDSDLDLTLFCGSAAVGASEFDDYAAFLRFGFRSGLQAGYTVRTLGFRLAADVDMKKLEV